MMREAGFSFLELIIVVAIIGVVAELALSTSKQPVSTQRLSAEAQKIGETFSLLVSQARASQTSFKILCDTQSLSNQQYRSSATLNAKSNMLNGTLGASVITATNGSATKTLSIVSSDLSNTLNLTCPAANSYITSDGTILTSDNKNFDLTLTAIVNPNLQSRIWMSKVGYPRIYLKDTSAKNVWTEVLN
jgi:prepilin-type N-terminal cleavage/methylation domain-containing protein